MTFIKREAFPQLDLKDSEEGRPVAHQLQVMNLGYFGEESNLFELTATYVEHSLKPLFKSLKGSSDSAEVSSHP